MDEDEAEPFKDFFFDEGLETLGSVCKDVTDEGLRA